MLLYKLTALRAWFVTVACWYLGAYHFKLFEPSYIFKNIGELHMASTIVGVVVALALLYKGKYAPYNSDVSWRSSWIQNLFLGTELSPQVRASMWLLDCLRALAAMDVSRYRLHLLRIMVH